MNLKSFFVNLFKYENKNNYNFSIMNEVNNQKIDLDDNKSSISSNINKNLEIIRTTYNYLLNNDVIIREFNVSASNTSYKAFTIYIEGLSNSISINQFILAPLMQKKYKKEPSNFDLLQLIDNTLLHQVNVKKIIKFEDAFSGINSGDCVLFIDTLNLAFSVDVKKYQQRSIDTPNNEPIIKGPQEAFIETLRTNTSLLRRIVNNENLVMETISVGKISKTTCSICYMQNICNSDLVAETKYRISNLDVDSLLSTGQLEQLIEENETWGVPQLISTERPDKCSKYLLQGRVVILINGNPYALILPSTIEDFLFSPEDTNLRPLFANFLRFIRVLAAILTLLLPGLYIAITSFHQEILPTELLFSILSSRENVPFPVIFELILMELSFELIREAGLRVPSPIGATVGIVGALILGDAAVNANIVSPILIIIVAITGIASFSIPDFSFGFHLRIFRFLFTALGFIAGFLGIGLGLFLYISLLCSLKSFGVPYTTPLSPSYKTRGNGYFIPPIWKQEYRAGFISPKKEQAQNKISKKWEQS